jgi:hypothetical protein
MAAYVGVVTGSPPLFRVKGGQYSTARDDGLVKGDKKMPTQQDMRAAAFLSERMRGRQLP